MNASPAAKAAWEAAANANLRARDGSELRLLPATSSAPFPSPSSTATATATTTANSAAAGAGAGGHRKTNSQASISGTKTKRGGGGGEGTAPSPSGTESFVLLPGSVVGRIPKNGSPNPKSPTSAHNATTAVGAGKKAGANGTPPKRTPSTSTGGGGGGTTARKTPSTTSDTSATQTAAAPLPVPTPSNNLHATMRLFTLLSSRSELDHPLCADCTNTLIENLERKLEETKRERDGYLAFEREVRKNKDSIASNALDEKKLEQKIQRVRYSLW